MMKDRAEAGAAARLRRSPKRCNGCRPAVRTVPQPCRACGAASEPAIVRERRGRNARAQLRYRRRI